MSLHQDRTASRHIFQDVRVPGVVAAVVILLATVGCGSKEPFQDRVPVFPVEGKITFKGEAMPGAFVAFHPKSKNQDVPVPRASVKPDGSLVVSTYDGGDGAPEGEYVLTVEWYKLVKNGGDVVAGPNVVPKKFAKPKTSGLVVNVAAGQNTIPPIQL